MSQSLNGEPLPEQAARIAKLAYDRVEDQIDSAPLPQAVVTAGVFTDKLQLLSDTRTVDLNVTVEHRGNAIVAELEELRRTLISQARQASNTALRSDTKAIEAEVVQAESEQSVSPSSLPSALPEG